MADPIPEAAFDAAMAQAGITLTAEERARLLGVSAHLAAMRGRLRPAEGVATEAAPVFAPLSSQGGTFR